MSVEPDGTTMDDGDNIQGQDEHVRMMDALCTLQNENEQLKAHVKELQGQKVCRWIAWDSPSYFYDTHCGEVGAERTNGKFCQYCGGKIKVRK